MKTLTELIEELDSLRHGTMREVNQKIVASLLEIDRRISIIEHSTRPISETPAQIKIN